MNKQLFWILTVAITVCALSYSAIAQPPGGPGGGRGGPGGPPGGPGMGPGGPGGGMGMGPGGPAAMFQNPEFAKMLNLTPAQSESLQRVMTEAGNAIREGMQGAFTPGGPPPNPDEMRQRMDKFIDEAQAKIDQVLQPEQRTKMREVTFQLSGGLNMNSPMAGLRTLETLNLTGAQKEQAQKIMAERDAEVRAAMQAAWQDQSIDMRTQEGREKMRANMEALSKKYADKVTAILTPDQKARGDKLTAAAPELRKQLGLPEPGQGPGQQRGQQGGQRGPGANSWRPGQEMPGNAPPPNRPGSFPRPRENSEN